MQPQRNEKRICKVDVQRKLKVPKMNFVLVTGIGKNSSSGRTAHHNGLVLGKMWRLGRSAHQWALPEMGSKHCNSEKHEATSSLPAKFAKNAYASIILRRCGHFKRAAQFDNTCSP